MKPSKLFHVLFPFIVMAIPWIYLAIVWNDLPASIPTHFGINGAPDKFGAKNTIIFDPLIFTVMGTLAYFLLRNIYKIDPKRKYSATTAVVLTKLSVVLLILFCAVSLFIIYSTLKGKIEGIPLIFCGFSLFFAYIGNLMHSIKPNYFVGFRVPWALENEDNWRRTHQLASKVWFIGGIALAIVSLLLNIKILIFVFFATVLVMVIIPAVYSYNIFRQSTKVTDTN